MRIRTAIAATVILLLLDASTAVGTTAPAQAAPGDLDTTFSGDGMQITDFGGEESGSGVVVQPDGKVLVAGSRDGDFALVRYTADGAPDASFSGDGKQTTDFGAAESGTAVAVQGDGKIVVAGTSIVSPTSGGTVPVVDFALARYHPDGSLDASFSSDGWQTTDFGGYDRAGGLVMQGDGKIVVAGASDVPTTTGGEDPPADFAIARYHPDGSLDAAFSGDGRQTSDLGGEDAASGVVIQGDGNVVAAGSSSPGQGGDFGLVRYRADGSLDTSFGVGGMLTTDFGGHDYGAGVAVQSDGRIVVAGASIPSGAHGDFGDFALARYDSDGSLDATFSGDGRQTTDFDVEDAGQDVAIQADGKIVVAGSSSPDFTLGSPDFALARYNTDGSPDATFSGDGRQTTDFGGSEVDDAGRGVAIQADGKIVVAGGTTPGADLSDFALARYQGGSGPTPPGTPPTNLSAPTTFGDATAGQTLTTSAGTWSGSIPIDYTYQLRRCDSAAGNCVDIAAANTTTHLLSAADVGHTIRVRETATNGYGTGWVDSAATAVVTAGVGAIAGTVRSAGTNTPIGSASVTCGTGSAKTGPDGTYSIPNLAPGGYSCTASAKRYTPSTHTVTIAPGQTTTANFSLARR